MNRAPPTIPNSPVDPLAGLAFGDGCWLNMGPAAGDGNLSLCVIVIRCPSKTIDLRPLRKALDATVDIVACVNMYAV